MKHAAAERMLIGLDGRPFCGPLAGTGRYVSELCRVLDAALPNARFVVYANRPVSLPVNSPRWRQRFDDSAMAARLPPALWYFLRAGRLARRDGLDVFWGSANFLPLGLGDRIPSILTIYDFVFRFFPETLSYKHRMIYQLFFKRGLVHADRVVTISAGTAQRLQALYGRQADLVVRPGVASWFAPPPAEKVREVLATYGIDRPYFLSVSTLEPRKNLEALIQALLQLRTDHQLAQVALVLVGQQGWRDSRLRTQIERAKSEGLPIFQTGFVKDADLPALYAGAMAVVMPSLYEGFGMPVLEALRCGARVVSSDIPEMREAGGVGPIYIAPTIEGIKAGLMQAFALSTTPALEGVIGESSSSWEEEGAHFVKLVCALR